MGAASRRTIGVTSSDYCFPCRAAAPSARRLARPKSRLGCLRLWGGVMPEVVLDAAGRRRSPATMPGFHAGRPPRNKGPRYPADPPKIEEIVAEMQGAGDCVHGRRLGALIVVLWRADLRIHEALGSLRPTSIRSEGPLVRRGKGGRRREVGMDERAWQQLQPCTSARLELPVGPLFCVVTGQRAGEPGQALPRGRSCGTPPPWPGCDAASPLTNSGTHTQSRWPAKACRLS